MELFVKEMKNRGIHLVPIIHAGVKIEDDYDIYEEGVSGDYFVKKENGERSSQVLLMPVTVTLSKEEYSAALENIEVINSAGFEIEDFGTGTLIVRACPMEITPDDLPDVIAEISGRFLDKRQDVDFEKLDWIFHSVACRSAIKSGDFTSRLEMERFAKQLLSMPDIRYCPHGRPVLIEMTERELEKNFGRI